MLPSLVQSEVHTEQFNTMADWNAPHFGPWGMGLNFPRLVKWENSYRSKKLFIYLRLKSSRKEI